MKYLMLLLTVTSCVYYGRSQTETTVWNGKTYYVYPYQQELEQVDLYFLQFAEYKEVLQRDEKNRKVISSKIEKISEEDNPYYAGIKKSRDMKKGEKFLRELINRKPDLFYRYELIQFSNLTPALEQIPDGDYIQYYRDLPYMDGNTLRYRNDVVAGVFTIKNNQINGYSEWYTANGSILKRGAYLGGAREGVWELFSININSDELKDTDDQDAILELLTSPNTKMDTLKEQYHYKNGLRHGLYQRNFNSFRLATGAYQNDKESGTWDLYSFRYRMNGQQLIKRTDTLVHIKHYTIAENPVTVPGLIVRNEVLYMHDYYNYDVEYDENGEMIQRPESDTNQLVLENPADLLGENNEFEDFSEMYEIPIETDTLEEGLELPEEDLHSYEGEEFEGSEYSDYPIEMNEMYTSQYGGFFNNKYYERLELMDSLGYKMKYTGIYEEYYVNGQLKMRFEIKDGKLVSEDTIFWSNGKPANTVHFDPETQMYTENFFDYNGKRYHTNTYNSHGTAQVEKELRGIVIDGLSYYPQERPVLEYTMDEIKEPLTTRTLTAATRWSQDSVLCATSYLDPATRILESSEFNRQGDKYLTESAQFSEDYESVNAVTNRTYGLLRLETTTSGSKFEGFFDFLGMQRSDSLDPQNNALALHSMYDLTNDNLLYYNNQLYSGSFKLSRDASRSAFKVSANSIQVQLAKQESYWKHLRKAMKKYRRKGTRAAILEWYGPYSSFNPYYNQLSFFPEIQEYFMVSGYGEYEGEYSDYSEYDNSVYSKSVEGQYVNGKPEGNWVIKDQFGKVHITMFYHNGVLQGEVKAYDVAYPPSKKALKYSYADSNIDYLLNGAPPAKKTRYLSSTSIYRNGILNGPNVTFNWKGDTLSFDNYQDGEEDGVSMKRNNLFYSIANYEDGMIDGISRTYMTLPGKDSILLFDLNFQNGSLQGESKSYHTNGKLAKRGFFLSGQPIDDYEAYDTLGFRYQYVKFQFGQPVEEKIWEENQLSVRYLFRWEDSIEFNTPDIAASSSFEGLAFDLGIIQNPYSEPYYGRPSLVDKTGIDYRITKYYPNDTVAREGQISKGKKTGHWKYYSYEGKLLYEVNYADTIIALNDSIRFKSKGILTYPDAKGQAASRSWIIEKVEKYDCSHSDHNEERMLYTFWQADTSVHRMNGYVKNYYDNGSLMNEGRVVNGLPEGIWKLYDSDGNLNQVGVYVHGKRDGRWLKGDLGNVKNMSEICLNPNLDNLEEIIAYQEKLLDISVIYYGLGKILRREYYGINMNNGDAPDGFGEEEYYGE